MGCKDAPLVGSATSDSLGGSGVVVRSITHLERVAKDEEEPSGLVPPRTSGHDTCAFWKLARGTVSTGLLVHGKDGDCMVIKGCVHSWSVIVSTSLDGGDTALGEVECMPDSGVGQEGGVDISGKGSTHFDSPLRSMWSMRFADTSSDISRASEEGGGVCGGLGSFEK